MANLTSSPAEDGREAAWTKQDFLKNADKLELLAANYNRCALALDNGRNREAKWHAATTGAATAQAAARFYFLGGETERARNAYKLALSAAQQAVRFAPPKSGMWGHVAGEPGANSTRRQQLRALTVLE